MNTLGDRIRDLRNELNLEQKELAKILNVHKGTISNWENNKRNPDNEMISKIADYFKVSVDYLLGRTDERCLIIDEPEISLHEQYANKIAKILESEGLEYTEDTIPEIINFSKYILSKKKQD
jgi:transcriptional regulator with XRE-family HTH domain